jgi:DNA-binding IclR family transcriptional regulator
LFRSRRHVPIVHGSRLEGLVEAINERAWAQRDASPVLSVALIEQVRAARQNGTSISVGHLVDELQKIASAHRESDSHLAAVVLDMIARDGHKHLS